MQNTDRMGGVLAAALTPLTADLKPDHEAIASHCRWLLDNGCNGLAVLGTTGEANSFSVGERLDIMENLVEAGIPPGTLMPGTGCCAITDTVTLSRKAVELGVGGVLMLPPFYYKGVSDDGLFAAYSEVIERVDDDRLRIYLYHFPQLSGVPISYDLIERLIKRYPSMICGMKDSSGEFANMAGAAKRFPGFAVLSGSDEFLLPLLNEGGAGCITAVNNIAASLAARVFANWKVDNARAEAEQERLTTVRKIVSAYPLSAALKDIMAEHSGHGEWRVLRPPLLPLKPEQAEELLGRLAETGYEIPPIG